MRAFVLVVLALGGLAPLALARRDAIPTARIASLSTAAEPSSAPRPRPAELLVCSTSQVAINPCTTAFNTPTRRTRTTTFTVQNKNTIENMNYIITCAVTGRVKSCAAPGTLYVPKNSSKTVILTWVTDTLPGSGTATLTADDDLTPVTGTVNVSVTLPVPTGLYVAVAAPHLQTQRVDSGAGGTARFVLRNGGEDSTGWSYAVSCTGSAIVGGSCAPTSGTVGLAANASSTINVAYTSAGGNAATGAIQLWMRRTADTTIRDSALVEVAIARRDSLLIVSDVNPGESIEPDQCVTASIGEGLAIECGALRAAHALPGVRTLGVNRAPVLLYNSAQARPFATVRADLTLPDTRIPDSVVLVLKDSAGNAISGARGAWAGSQWRARSSRRVAVAFDAVSWPSGVHRYTLEGRRWYGALMETLSVTGSLWVVNRSASPYGAGWWVAGVEAITNPDGNLRWTGGDGATRRYVNQGGNVWVAPSLERPDTIVLVGTSYYERRLPRGLRVRFDYGSGRHIQTVNRLGHVTRFVYQGGTVRLDSIVVPSGSLVRAYSFQYDVNGLLRAVHAPRLSAATARRDSLVVDGGQVTTIQQRDGSTSRFLYQDAYTFRMTGRINEAGDTTRVALSTPGTITTVSLPRSAGVRDTMLTAVAEVRGLAGSAALPLGNAYTLLFGPRRTIGDSTQFWIDRWGAPTVVRNAVGDETQLVRGDARFPTLVTRLRSPTGQLLGATYTVRGLAATITDSATVVGGAYSTTTYRWDPTWDAVTYARGPGGDSVTMAYDGGNGNLLWRQDGRGSSTRTTWTCPCLVDT